jgi:hypothetical protein
MKRFDLFNRRTHLYLGMFVMPWLVMYGLSSFMLNHQAWFQSNPTPQWQLLFEREYHHSVPEQGELRGTAYEILKDTNLEGAFWVQRTKPDVLEINRFRFRDEIRLTYSMKDQRLRAERQQFEAGQVVHRLHFRGGFEQPTFFNNVWAVLVDVACVAILLWIASGLIMWWRLTRLRFWGAVALGGGLVSFILLIWQL